MLSIRTTGAASGLRRGADALYCVAARVALHFAIRLLAEFWASGLRPVRFPPQRPLLLLLRSWVAKSR